ncbi:helix-turn-helix domain-containing protein [Eubacterium ramulus]|nr:helix-turn-helix domain-containing protein [Eubacterium ramulus]
MSMFFSKSIRKDGEILLYEKVATLCQNNNLTIAKLERECEMGNGTVRGWKNSSPSIENLKKVADYFNITVDKLISDPAEKNMV